MIKIPRTCPRGRTDCIALSNLVSDCGNSFFCCGESDGKNRIVEQDIYTVCFKGEYRDEMSHHDKRDLTHQASVLVQAIAVVEKSYSEESDWSPWIEEPKT